MSIRDLIADKKQDYFLDFVREVLSANYGHCYRD